VGRFGDERKKGKTRKTGTRSAMRLRLREEDENIL
jgi:hypothetical protein